MFLASTLQWCKPKLPENTVTTTTFSTKLPTREEAGDKVMLQILDLIEYGRSQVLNRGHVEVIKSYLDEIDNYYN